MSDGDRETADANAGISPGAFVNLFDHYVQSRREFGVNVSAAAAADIMSAVTSRKNVQIALKAVQLWERG